MSDQTGWNAPKPDTVPRPMWWPASTALGITLGAWGLLTSPIILIIGVGLLGVSLGAWIGEMRHEQA